MLQKEVEAVHHYARTHMQLQSDQMKRHYDAHLRGEKLEVDTPVWLHNPQRKKGGSHLN